MLIVFVVHSLEEEPHQVLDIFHDRVLVAQCRAGCDLRYLDDLDLDRGQCWTVCHRQGRAELCRAPGQK